MTEPAERSKVEAIKDRSGHLRGTIAAELADPGDSFDHDNQVLLKFHGIYQQDDRDVRSERTRAKAGLDYSCMVRAAVPGGALTAEQYLAMDDLTRELADGSLRITTRQGIQWHFVAKADLAPLLRQLNQKLVTTLAACGDVVRNITCCPAPLADREAAEVEVWARRLAEHLRPRTSAYYQLWVDGERAVSAAEPVDPDDEPLYGTTYLPRKFKVGLAWPGDNCIDVYSQDVGIVPVIGEDGLRGFTVLVGGGMGKTHNDDSTYPRQADPLATVAPADLVAVVETVVAIQRDHGNRTERDHARLKYLIDAWGLPRFRVEVERRLGHPLAEPEPLAWSGCDDHLGWHRQDDGTWFLGVGVQSGRVKDSAGLALRSGLRAVIERFSPGVRLTARQDLLLTGLAEGDRGAVVKVLRDHGVVLADELPGLERNALACPALPTCGQALTEAERALPGLLSQLRDELDQVDLADLAPHVRLTGCPNGCARPYSAEIGIVGRGKKSYDVHVGGDVAGTRLNGVFAENVPRDKLVEVLHPLFEHYRDARITDEAFGDFCDREGVDELRARLGNESWVRQKRQLANAG
ncbi:MAG: NADPH-dependent assimilatory sulfite reductase hemoprotein subunit [Actinomycetota bacterium]|nr:NADPH-dependent assimilatory sulfite reductase hemoprotein subunit [Actinomycetota bacterium]